MMIPNLINDFLKAFSKEIEKVPEEGFYDTFKYTKTGNNLTHPRTIGYITKVLWEMEIAATIEIDLRINLKGVKFQPDIFARNNQYQPVVVIDYESPNSSDARIVSKNIESYLKWNPSIPYVVITTLPKNKSPDWELRYTSSGYCNEHHKGRRGDIQKNPFEYWYKEYRKELKKYKEKLNSVYFININGKEATLEKI